MRAVGGTGRDLGEMLGEAGAQRLRPALDAGGVEHDLAHGGIRQGLGDAVDRGPRRMVRALDEGQAGDDLRLVLADQIAPPDTRAGAEIHAEDAEIAGRFGHRPDHGAGVLMRDVRHGEAEMEAGAVAHRRVAAGDVGMDRVISLHEGEGRDDDAPDALDRVERQQPLMAQRQALHHVGLATRAEGRPRNLRLLDRDQRLDDGGALHQEAVHGSVDAIDLAAQIGKGRRSGFGHGVRPTSRRNGLQPSSRGAAKDAPERAGTAFETRTNIRSSG